MIPVLFLCAYRNLIMTYVITSYFQALQPKFIVAEYPSNGVILRLIAGFPGQGRGAHPKRSPHINLLLTERTGLPPSHH